ncbi:MAG: DUF4912 domain-containing protein [Spirochaetaceae bacterium]|jgi:hypothetical protein|nr:DUF4912 domain-containing protein [Spirochaetaceae bacterium]
MLSAAGLSPSYLERLSTPELKDLAVQFGIDIPQDLERLFIIEELLENAPCLTFFQPGRIKTCSAETYFVDNENISLVPDPVELPKRYNITRIDAIVRDPLWVFVFWEIREADRRLHERNPGFHGYFLRVSLDKCKFGAAVSSLFTIPVSVSDSEWYIHFPPDAPCRKICNSTGEPSDTLFNVALCVSYANTESVLTRTHPFKLPRTFELSERMPANDENTLLRMSGIDDLTILRNGERVSVIPKNNDTCAR